MVGFNRRFAPQIQKIKKLLSSITEPKSIVMTVNAGYIAKDHWSQDLKIGGGRIIGEACHFIDLLRFLIGKSITNYQIEYMNSSSKDTANIQLSFLDGSIGNIHYYSNGSKSFPKERLEVFAMGGVLQLDNYRTLKGFDWPNFKKMNLWRQDKAVSQENSFSPISIDEIFEVSKVSIDLANQ